MQLSKEKSNNGGYYIKLKIGKFEQTSYWSAPPDSVDHVGLCYIQDRYPMVKNNTMLDKFKKHFKELW